MIKIALAFMIMTSALCGRAQDLSKVSITQLDSLIRNSTTPIVVNFWATWCAPCVEEIPWFSEKVRKYRNKGVKLILVSLDGKSDYPGKTLAFLKKKKPEAAWLWLNETNADYFCPFIDPRWSGSIPSSLFVNNSKGKREFAEKQLSADQLEKYILEILN